jgi:NADH:ubiquinone oxidoreductase subunit 2 (subunit N)
MRNPKRRTDLRRLPWHGRVCVYVLYASMLGIPLVGLFGIFGSIISHSTYIRVIQFWLGSAFAALAIITSAALLVIERSQPLFQPARTSPLWYRAIIGWLGFAILVVGLWLALVYSLPRPGHA